jgi:cysteine desulfurase
VGPKFPIYLDHHATTPTDPRVVEVMRPYFSERFGNAASASHVFGWRAEAAVEQSRERLAAAIGARDPREIVFTSGTTESDNLALKGVARATRKRRDHLITVQTEHPAVLESCAALEREGFRVTLLPVDRSGLVDPDAVRSAIGDRTLLVSVMAANSEIGVLQPLEVIGRICRERGVLLHTDAAQAVGKVPIDVEAAHIDLLSMCAHKLYGPPGVGALYIRRRRPRIRLEPLFHGGGQESGHRSGTLPLPLIVGFAEAVDLCMEGLESEAARLRELRDGLWRRLEAGLDDLHLNGHPEQRLPGNLNVAFPGAEADALIASLKDVALSSGSACSSARPEPSHVLRALGLPDSLVAASLRFGLGRWNSAEEIDWVADQVIAQVREQREKRAGSGPGRRRRVSEH